MLCFPGVIIVLLSIYWNNLFLIQLFIYQLTVFFLWPSLSGAGSLLLLLFPGDPPLPALSILHTQSDCFLHLLHGAILCYLRLTGILGGKGMEQDCQGAGLLERGVWISLPDWSDEMKSVWESHCTRGTQGQGHCLSWSSAHSYKSFFLGTTIHTYT